MERNVMVTLGGGSAADGAWVYPALADTSERWNGWLAAPRFDRKTLEEIAADFATCPGSERITIDADGVWAWWPDYANDYADPRGERYEWDADGRCALGANGWIWLEADEEE